MNDTKSRALPNLAHPNSHRPPKVDPATDYIDRTGRHLSLSERMAERSRTPSNSDHQEVF